MQATVKQQVMVVSGITKLFPVNVTIFGAVKKRKEASQSQSQLTWQLQ